MAELKLPFEEETVDLSVPRTAEYLAVNPRGLVPSLLYNGHVITESAIVAQFLADAHPSHLIPIGGTPEGALARARINFFVDTFFSKAHPHYHRALFASSEGEAEKAAAEFIKQLEKEVEPLLGDAGPYFGGSQTLTLAEVNCLQRGKTKKKKRLFAVAMYANRMVGADRFVHPAIVGSTQERCRT